MSAELLDTIFTAFEVAVAAVSALFAIRLLSKRTRTMAQIYFAFATISLLMSSLYWLAYEMLQIEARMPFAANEFGEAATFLLMAAGLGTISRGGGVGARTEVLLTALFSLGNAAMWIVWNGDWVEALLTGPIYIFFLCFCARCLKQSGALRRWEWVLLGVLSFVILGLEISSEIWKQFPAVELCLYSIGCLVVLMWVWKLIEAWRKKSSPSTMLVLTVCTFGWSLSFMYMSTGLWYHTAEFFNILTIPMMISCVKREGTP